MIDTPMVLTGEDLSEVELPVIGTEPLEYLGETDTHAFHFMSSTDGISISGDNFEETLIFDYEGNDISDQYRQQLDTNIGVSTFIPVSHHPFNHPFITYPVEAYMAGSSTNYSLVNAEGEIIMDSYLTMAATKIDMRRMSNGEVIFNGRALAASADGPSVLAADDFMGDTDTLYDLHTGEVILEVRADGILSAVWGWVVAWRGD